MRAIVPAVFALFAVFAPVAPTLAQPHLKSTDLQDYVGQYVLTDERVLSVTQRRGKLVAQVAGRPAVTLARIAPATFASPDGAIVLTFDQRPNGNVAGVTVSAAAATASAEDKQAL